MNFLPKIIISATLAASLIACSGDDDDSSPAPAPEVETAQIRIFHASQDAPPVDVSLNGAVALSGVDYAVSSELLEVDAGTSSVQIDGLLPNDQTTTVIGPVDLTFEADMVYEILALNDVANIEPVVISRSADFEESMVRVTVLHGASAAPQVDVHVTAPEAELSADTVLGTFAFKETLGPVEIGAGDYQIRVTLPDTTTVVYDSGTLSLAAGSDIFISAIVNVNTASEGKSPIALLVAANDGAASTLVSADDGADLRVVHNSADAPEVDIVVNDGFAQPLVEDLGFATFTDYVNVPADTYNVKVAAAGTETVVIDADLALENGAVYSVIALNTLENIEPLVLVDDTRSIATEARVRVIHGSANAGAVDVYVTAPDADITAATPVLTGIELQADSGYLGLAAGSYDVTVTPTGSTDAAIGPANINVEAGGIYTIIARDGADLNGFDVMLLDDF